MAANQWQDLPTRILSWGSMKSSRSSALSGSTMFLNKPENVKAILSINFKDYGIGHRLETFKPLLGAGIFDSDGDHWASSRALIRPNFTRDQVADLTSFEHLIQDLFSILPRDGETVVDLQDLFFRYAIDSATEFLFGQSVGSLKKSQSELSFAQAFNYAQEAIITRATLGPLNMFYRDQKADKCNRICRDFAQQFVEEAVHAIESEKSDTMWDKLRREVAGLQGRVPTYSELRDLKYVQCCMNESLRLHPVVPRNDRMAEFKILESRDPGPWEESLTLTLCSRNGTKVCLTPA
ncbi:cytochrome p450 [Hirsutella rhossiliensis]|uniref:Cytochrome p450 domain-containing protein n=1 Tax=Hirsutella rhossiliensis TaxID=111463 RepID=A0A9P8SI75_9HYPO|nr:cytochrome p450 domain-containing protein [Hirsutella rhossiliensis]KAH0961731.1 cytochrome p450 domain-containing protein [Hirsutella rhossiliensis]